MMINEEQNTEQKHTSIIIRDWKDKDFKRYEYWNTGQFKWMEYNDPYYPQKTKKELTEAMKSLNNSFKLI